MYILSGLKEAPVGTSLRGVVNTGTVFNYHLYDVSDDDSAVAAAQVLLSSELGCSAIKNAVLKHDGRSIKKYGRMEKNCAIH
jgi:hypothetical protein